MIKIWGWIGSSNVQKVLWCCDELALAYELEDRGWPYAGYKEPAYLALNPNGLVPTIEDRDFVLWESNSVVRYLADKYGDGKLTPRTPEERASSNRWMDWHLTTMGPLMGPLYRAFIRTAPEDRDSERIRVSQASAEKGWSILGRYLAESDFVGGTMVQPSHRAPRTECRQGVVRSALQPACVPETHEQAAHLTTGRTMEIGPWDHGTARPEARRLWRRAQKIS